MSRSPKCQVVALALLTASLASLRAADVRLNLEVTPTNLFVRWSATALFPSGHAVPAKAVGPFVVLESSKDLIRWTVLGEFALPSAGDRVEEVVTIQRDPASSLFWRLTRTVRLAQAQLAGADMSGADLSGADLFAADLRFADLTGADLSGADLRAANLFGAKLDQSVLSGTQMPEAECALADPDAELMALELSNELLPPASLYTRLDSDLEAIRGAYPDMRGIHHRARWIVGVLLVNREVDSIGVFLNAGLSPEPTGFGTRSTSFTELRFAERYNPEVLAIIYGGVLGATAIEPDWYVGDGNDIEYDSLSDEYRFQLGWGDCPSGCIGKHFWVFTVHDGKVTLVREEGTPFGGWHLPPGGTD